MGFRVTVLGSGTIIPSSERRATSLLVESGSHTLLFDCGPGALDAIEENGFSWRALRQVFLTHFHPDHSLGIGHLIAAVNADPVSHFDGTLTVFGPRGLADHVSRWNALYRSTVPAWSFLETRELEGKAVPLGDDTVVRSAPAAHGSAPALSYRVDHKGKSIVYTGDTGHTESLVELARGATLLIAECCFPDARAVEGHLSPSSAGRLAAEAAARHVILVHMYPVFDGESPLAGARKHYRGPIEIGYDGLQFDLE